VETGYYLKEPQFGNLIRTALKLGFEIFPYEADLKYFGKDREIQQAKNIQQVLKSDPILVDVFLIIKEVTMLKMSDFYQYPSVGSGYFCILP
jgi:hypothetical protein